MTFENTSPSEPEAGDTELVSKAAPPSLERTEGRLEIGFASRGQKSALLHLYQRGCARARFPTVDQIDVPEAVLINTAGGLTGGDQINYNINLQEDARLTVSGQAAEKIYRSVGTTEAMIRSEISVKAGAFLEWLPQETILFEGSRLNRRNDVHLVTGSRFLAVEATVFGRKAHGESLHRAHVKDGWKIWKDGRLLWFDNLVLDGDIAELSKRKALMSGAGAVATILLADEEVRRHLDVARQAARECEARAAVSCRGGLLIFRVLGEDGYALRRALVEILTIMRAEIAGTEVPLPRVWEN
ncbi:MAG: urease accessory protein UreD [Proteobacteria bacterium]|nr:urease accessory protein UreD [Pseudomonadota bacterium]